MTPEQKDRLTKMANNLDECAENAERMVALLQSEFDAFEARTGHNVYVVRDYVDHRSAAKRQRQEASDIRSALDALADSQPASAADTLHGPYGYLIMPEGLAEDEWYLADDPKTDAASEPLYAKREIPLGKPAPAADTAQAVVVPREPTKEMMHAFLRAGRLPEDPFRKLYAAMLAAAPTHPAPLDAERNAIEARAREIAGYYPQSSDGRNTFVMFADWIAARSRVEGKDNV